MWTERFTGNPRQFFYSPAITELAHLAGIKNDLVGCAATHL